MDWAEKVKLHKEGAFDRGPRYKKASPEQVKKNKAWYEKMKKAGKVLSAKETEKLRAKDIPEDYGAGFDGTNELDDKYRKDTPGQPTVLRRVKKLVKEKLRSYKHLKPRRTTGYTDVPGKNLKGKADSDKAMNLGHKKKEHAEKVIEK